MKRMEWILPCSILLLIAAISEADLINFESGSEGAFRGGRGPGDREYPSPGQHPAGNRCS